MTKTIRFGAAGIAMFAALGMSSAAHADTETANASVEILDALVLTNTAGLDFGALVVSGTGGTVSLYAASIMFGLFQGGIVPCYAFIVREYFPANEVGRRVGIVIMATLFGMALGGWISGEIFDATGSYQAAFLNGIAWNLMNMGIVLFLLQRRRRFDAVPAVA